MKVLALDAMGVVYRSRSIVSELLVPFLRGRVETTPDILRELYRACSLGEFSSAEFWREVGLDPSVEGEYLAGYSMHEGAREFTEEARGHFDSVWYLSNDVSEWSARLRKRFRLEALFDGFVVSGDVRSRKPSREIFEAFLSAAGAAAGEILLVDNKRENIAAAMELGMEGVLFGQQTDSSADLSAVSGFSELRRLLLSPKAG